MKPVSRWLALLAALLLSIALFFPFWKIILEAPQYPEGLGMKIWITGLTGDMEKINGLNHYIGMKLIYEEDFPEFVYLPYAFGLLIGLALLTALLRKKWLVWTWLAYAGVFATVLFYRFWRWEYEYGHDLDPMAAIKIPGMSYQPPLFGWKQLLNFLAGSLPDIGAYLTMAAVLCFVTILWLERTKNRVIGTSALAIAMVSLGACSSELKPIRYGEDQCQFCRMTIADPHYGAALHTDKGKTYPFDSIECMVDYLKENATSGTAYATSYDAPGVLVAMDQLTVLKGPGIQSPMGGHLMALTQPESIAFWEDKAEAHVVTWESLIQP
jgi:copper chaperone NosL